MNPLIWQSILSVLVLLGIGRGFQLLLWRSMNFRRSLNFVFLQVSIPKKESKEDLERERDQTSEIRRVIGVGEHFFQTLFQKFLKIFFRD